MSLLKVFVVSSLLFRVTRMGGNAQTWWFTLKKWVSNCPEVLQIIPVDDRLEANEFTLNAESILCLEWIFDKDCLQVCRGPSEESTQNITQRVVLSFVSSVFDPMGVFGRVLW